MKRFFAFLLGVALSLSFFPPAFAASYSTAPTASVWSIYHPSLRFLYEQLDSEEKRAFSYRYDAIALGKVEQWSIDRFALTPYQEERVEMVLEYDCPELLCSVTSRISAFYGIMEGESQYQEYAVDINKLVASCAKALDAIKSKPEWGYTDFSKQQTYDRYFPKRCVYLLDNDEPGRTKLAARVRDLSSVIINRTAVCEGFARSTQFAMRYFGIPCIYVIGETARAGHAWNIVNIDGYWYHYDATWNDVGGFGMPYFNLADQDIYKSRSLDRRFADYGFSLPSCWDRSYDYLR